MNEMNSSTKPLDGIRLEVAKRRIATFSKRFGHPHLYLAYHAAFPLAITPDLLYHLWANFPRNIHGELLHIPWVAVADLLLSSLCEEVSQELYEMNVSVRSELLSSLKADINFGNQRIKELSSFMFAYIKHQLDSSDPAIHDYAHAQQWAALAYIKPDEAAQKLAMALHLSMEQDDTTEQVRIASLIETFAEPLEGFTPLLIYARGLRYLARGDIGSAVAQFRQIIGSKNVLEVEGIKLRVPVQMTRETQKVWQKAERKQILHTSLGNKLLVVTVGTAVAGVGQEIMKQMNARPQSDLKVMVRYIDTARLVNRYSMRDGEWFQMMVDPVHMKALYNNRANRPQLNRFLYTGLLPKPTSVGGGSIRYNGSGAVLVNHDNLKKWLSANMTGLTRLGDNQTNFSVALIISAVGATGSGSLEYLAEVIADAAQEVNVPIPIRMDIFVLQPSMEGVSQLGLANTLALYAELAASRLTQDDMYDKLYLGRIVMVGWGSSRSLASIEQLEETAATLVRLINDPISYLAAEYQEREVDNHVLLHIDALTELPTHLSSATPVTISLGQLEEQIIQRDAARLIDNLVFGRANGNELFIGTLATSMTGDSPEERYSNLLQYLTSGEGGGLRSLRKGFREQALNYLPQEQASKLEGTWLSDKTQIAQQVGAMSTVGHRLINEISASWLRLRRDGMVVNSTLSLSSLHGHYQKLNQILNETLKFAKEMTWEVLDDSRVAARLKEVETAAKARGRRVEQQRQGAIEGAVREIQRNVRAQLHRQANPIAIDVLEELAYRSSEALISLEVVLQQLERQRQMIDSWNIASRELNFGIAHPLELPVLADEKAVEDYYERVSIFTTRSLGRVRATTEMNPIADFRRWLSDQQNIEYLYKGDIDFLLRVAQNYTRDKVHDEVIKYSVLDVLLQGREEALPQRLAAAAELAHPLISFNRRFAPEREEVWHICAYVKDKDQRDALQKAIDRVFPQGRCSLLDTKDPTEIVVFYYVDGIPASAVNDLTGRCLEAFLKLRRNWYTYSGPKSGNDTANTQAQRVGIPIYSGQEAEKRVLDQGIICKLCKVSGRYIDEYRDLQDLHDCE